MPNFLPLAAMSLTLMANAAFAQAPPTQPVLPKFDKMSQDRITIMTTRPGRFIYNRIPAFEIDSVVTDPQDGSTFRKYYHLHGNPRVTLSIEAHSDNTAKKISEKQVTQRCLQMPLNGGAESPLATFKLNGKSGLEVMLDGKQPAMILPFGEREFLKLEREAVTSERYRQVALGLAQ